MVKLGQFKASFIPYTASIAVSLAILACEILAVKLGHEKPFPRATISSTSDHYPQFIIFRIATECGATLLIITWFCNYFLVHSLYPKINRYFPGLSVFLGTAGALCLMGSTATLDTGKHRTDWHQTCATTFFVLTILASLYNTFISVVVYRKSKGFTKGGMLVKYLLTFLLFVWLCLALFYKSPNRYFGNIVEYTLAYLILGYVALIGYDMKDWRMAYEVNDKQAAVV